jgi:hypothetical protein
MIVDGRLNGLFRRRYETGALAEEVEMKSGEPDGIAQSLLSQRLLEVANDAEERKNYRAEDVEGWRTHRVDGPNDDDCCICKISRSECSDGMPPNVKFSPKICHFTFPTN